MWSRDWNEGSTDWIVGTMAISILLFAGAFCTFIGIAGILLIPSHISPKLHLLWMLHLGTYAVGLPIGVVAIWHRRLAARIAIVDLILGYAVILVILGVSWPLGTVITTKLLFDEWPLVFLAATIVIRALFKNDLGMPAKTRP